MGPAFAFQGIFDRYDSIVKKGVDGRFWKSIIRPLPAQSKRKTPWQTKSYVGFDSGLLQIIEAQKE
ncbi:hypothetical protein, partial [Pseudomonas sp. IPO3775]